MTSPLYRQPFINNSFSPFVEVSKGGVFVFFFFFVVGCAERLRGQRDQPASFKKRGLTLKGGKFI